MRSTVEAEMAAERAELTAKREDAREHEREAFKRVDEADAALSKVVRPNADTISKKEAAAWEEVIKANRVAWAYHDQVTHLTRQLAVLDDPQELAYRVGRHGRKDRRREERRRERKGGRMTEPREEKPLAKSTINTIVKGMEAGKSGREIADELNTAKIESPGRGGHWNGQKVRQVFAQETGTKDIRSFRSSKRGTAKRTTAKRESAKRETAKRESTKRAAGKRSQAKTASTKRATSKRGTAKRASSKRGSAAPANGDTRPPDVEEVEVEEAEVEAPPVADVPPREVTPLSKEAQASGTSRGGSGHRKREGKRGGSRRGA